MAQAIDFIVSKMLNSLAFSNPGHQGKTKFGSQMASQLLGNRKVIGALLPKTKSWFLLNTDIVSKDAMLYGPWEPENVTETVGSVYADAFALNKQDPVRQFLHGQVETITFQARFYAVFALMEVEAKVQTLKSWCRKDNDLGRPPICYFWVGLDQHAKMESCIVKSVSVAYDKPGFLGSMQGATVQIVLEKYVPFSLDDVDNFDTRYHFSKVGDTFEMLAMSEYGDPMLGVHLRQNHPQHLQLQPGDIVKLPARGGSIRTAKKQPSSLALKNIHKRRSNPQKVNHERARSARREPSLRYTTT